MPVSSNQYGIDVWADLIDPTLIAIGTRAINLYNIFIKMKSSSTRCDTPGCNGKVQAICFTCNRLFCFSCSIAHAQENSKNPHNILEL